MKAQRRTRRASQIKAEKLDAGLPYQDAVDAALPHLEEHRARARIDLAFRALVLFLKALKKWLRALPEYRLVAVSRYVVVDGDRSPMVAQMRADLESQAQAERAAVSDLQAESDAPIRLPPVELITERVLGLKSDRVG